jgi:NADH-quinone oxidoreductase subunit G
MVQQLAAIAKACGVTAAHLSALLNAAQVTAVHQAIADSLKSANVSTVLLGNISQQHPQLSALRQLAAAIAETTNSVLGYLPEAANSAGAWLAGAIPHREAGGVKSVLQGKPASAMAGTAIITFNIEPELDCANGSRALATLKNAEFVVAISSYVTENIKATADVLLPHSGRVFTG